MAYLGKEFKFEKEENFDAFINALGSAEEKAKSFLSFKPNQKLEKNGDEYTLTLNSGDFKKEVTFKAGVPFDEIIGTVGLQSKSVVNVDGDTFTQIQDFGPKGTVTFKREYSPSSLKVTMSASKFDVTAVRYYVPA